MERSKLSVDQKWQIASKLLTSEHWEAVSICKRNISLALFAGDPHGVNVDCDSCAMNCDNRFCHFCHVGMSKNIYINKFYVIKAYLSLKLEV